MAAIGAGLSNHPAEQAIIAPTISRGHVSDVASAGALAEYGHLGGIAAECLNVFLNPSQAQVLVLEAEVGHAGIDDLLAGEESPEGETVCSC